MGHADRAMKDHRIVLESTLEIRYITLIII